MKLLEDRLLELMHENPKGFTYNPMNDELLRAEDFTQSCYVYSLDLGGAPRVSDRTDIMFTVFNWLKNYDSKNFIGYWVDENGIKYWDISRATLDLSMAMHAAKENNQMYIYDLFKQKDIKVE